MTTGVQGGFGTTIKITVTSSLVAIVHAQDIEFPEFEKILADITAHDSPGGYQELVSTGKRKMNSFKVKLTWDINAATHAAVQAAFTTDPPVTMSVQDSHGNETISFAAHIQKIGRVGKQDEGYYADVTIQPTGIPTLVTGS